jgi:hypothetical protein
LKNLSQWIRIRKELYLQVERQVRHRLGQDKSELMQYQNEYDKEFQKKWTVASKETLLKQIEASRIVMMGDFHALHQSQKAQLRILRSLPADRKIILAVEFFEAQDQDKVSRFLSGKMSEKEFLRSIQWQLKWGFPWEHYRGLMRWAQKNKVSVVALNKSFKKRTAVSLKTRDFFAGKRIAEVASKNPNHLIFVIFGDLHLASSHLPHQIMRSLGPSIQKKTIRIFQNSERIYFQLLKRELDSHADLVRISQNTFCLMSVAPWVKWQNYLMYIERTYDLGLEDSDDDDHLLDYTDHVGRYVKIISDELGLNVSLGELSVYTAEDNSLWNQLRGRFDEKSMKWVESMISDGMSFYVPELKLAYLGQSSVNHAASLAMRYIHGQLSACKKTPTQPEENFLALIWIEGLAYFGSKIINHKRKSDTLVDIKASLAVRGQANVAKEALQLALAQKMHELMVVTGSVNHKLQAKPRSKWSYIIAAQLLGGMLGERLYGGYRKGLISTATIGGFLRKSFDAASFKLAYYDIMEIIESLPAPFLSKKEKL